MWQRSMPLQVAATCRLEQCCTTNRSRSMLTVSDFTQVCTAATFSYCTTPAEAIRCSLSQALAVMCLAGEPPVGGPTRH